MRFFTPSRNTAVAAALAIAMSGTAFAAPQDYRFELVQATPAGPGKSDVTVQLVRTSGAPVKDAVISASGADMASTGMAGMVGQAVSVSAEQPGRQRFRIDTGMAGPWTLHLSAKVPGTTRVERHYFSSVKWTQVRTVHGEGEVVAGAVTFAAQ